MKYRTLGRTGAEFSEIIFACGETPGMMSGDDTELMRHWINTANRHTGGMPREQLQDPEQLVELVHYLDAMRGRP